MFHSSTLSVPIRALLVHPCMMVLLNLCAILGLFLIDITSALALPKDQDIIYASIVLGVLVVFMTEFALNCLFVEKYVVSVFFVLDFASFFFLLPDIYFVWLPMAGASSNINFFENGNDLTVYRATLASRNAAYIGRVLRVLRLARICI